MAKCPLCNTTVPFRFSCDLLQVTEREFIHGFPLIRSTRGCGHAVPNMHVSSSGNLHCALWRHKWTMSDTHIVLGTTNSSLHLNNTNLLQIGTFITSHSCYINLWTSFWKTSLKANLSSALLASVDNL